MTFRALGLRWLLPAAAFVACATPVAAQCESGPRARLLVVVDTSSTMTLHMFDKNPSWGDGSTFYRDAVMTRGLTATPGFGLYTGYQVPPAACTSTSLSDFDGTNSRLFAAKSALTSAVSTMQQVDWGLLRFAGTDCAVVSTKTPTVTTCLNDSTCPAGTFCIGGLCNTDNNLCSTAIAYDQACHRTSATTSTWSGSCGTAVAAGNAVCASPEVCRADSDCVGAGAGQCALLSLGPVRTCTCVTAGNCPAGYTCSSGRCAYSQGCQTGGSVVVDPTAAGNASLVAGWLDGIEDRVLVPVNTELRASGSSPLAAAIRGATAWYNGVKGGDPVIACRPYALVLITDGLDTCDTDPVNGPIAAASGFVAATQPGARRPNTVHVIATAFNGASKAALDAVAAAGGTGSARTADTAAALSAALADIAQSTTLVERCNNADDDCDGSCDDPFPGVAVTNVACSNRHAGTACNNGALPGTHCFASGVVVCSADQLGQTCSAPTCATNAAFCPTAEGATGCNGIDDDCDGVVDDCTAGVAGSCCF